MQCSSMVPSDSWTAAVHTQPMRVQCPAGQIGSQAQLCAGGNMGKQACMATLERLPDLTESPGWAGHNHGWEVAYYRLHLCHSPLFN